MKRTKLFVLAICFCFVGTLSSFAQVDNAAQATTMTNSIDSQVSLTSSQRDQVYTINMTYLNAASNLDKSNLADGRFYAERRALNVTRQSAIAQVLTDDQMRLLVGNKRK